MIEQTAYCLKGKLGLLALEQRQRIQDVFGIVGSEGIRQGIGGRPLSDLDQALDIEAVLVNAVSQIPNVVTLRGHRRGDPSDEQREADDTELGGRKAEQAH